MALARRLSLRVAEGFQSLIPEALIWAYSNSDLEENADKDMRQEELLSALSASGGFFGAREITHGKPPTAPSNPPSERAQNADTGHFRGSAYWWRHAGLVGV